MLPAAAATLPGYDGATPLQLVTITVLIGCMSGWRRSIEIATTASIIASACFATSGGSIAKTRKAATSAPACNATLTSRNLNHTHVTITDTSSSGHGIIRRRPNLRFAITILRGRAVADAPTHSLGGQGVAVAPMAPWGAVEAVGPIGHGVTVVAPLVLLYGCAWHGVSGMGIVSEPINMLQEVANIIRRASSWASRGSSSSTALRCIAIVTPVAPSILVELAPAEVHIECLRCPAFTGIGWSHGVR